MVKFALSLSALGRDEAGRQKVLDYLADFGIEQSGGGLTTLSFVASEASFAAAFQSTVPPAKRDAHTVGASAPLHTPDIPVPQPLSAFVDHVSVAPPSRRFGGEP